MKILSIAAAALGGVLMLTGTADAAIVYGANFCEPTVYPDSPQITKTDTQISIGGTTDQFVYLSCPLPNTKNLTGGLSTGSVRLRATSVNSSCAIIAATQFGSVLSSQYRAVTTPNVDTHLYVYDNVDVSDAYGSMYLYCVLTGGSRVMSYRYNEQ